ncbi:hypothetical protein CNMCM5623_003946 [Aspergillus felis]|uniref:Uncharacterized protein n=1 Tax=Aspergillus felis TaxID=1287682 RepID=A0A8H6QGM7_9EURO|nr:hypothetical protein CNMCM5623_003946 [Aspergillus felis]
MTLHEIVRAMFGSVPDEVIDQALAPFLLQALWKLTEDRKVGFEPGDPVKRKWFAVARYADVYHLRNPEDGKPMLNLPLRNLLSQRSCTPVCA